MRGAVPVSQPPAAPAHERSEAASIVLRLPEGDPAKGETLHQAVEPGQRERVLALVRNQSGIVDNYDIRVEGMPQDWWSVYPGTVYLVPFGSGGTYEQEVEIHLHPPRGPEAEARVWELQIVADSKAMRTVAAQAPLALHIQPYVETATTLRPQRKKGRRKATFDVTVANKANAPVLVALDGEDPDGELRFGFNRPPQEIPAGAVVTSQMQVRPPKQIWIGRAREHRLQVNTITGEEAAERAAEEPVSADVLLQAGPQPKKKWYKRRPPQVPGMYPPRVFKPQMYPPDVNIGPGGISIRKPTFRAPQVQAPQMGQMNASQFAKPGQLKLPGRGGSSAPAAPLMPTQGVFKQKPWLPWWLLPLLLAAPAAALPVPAQPAADRAGAEGRGREVDVRRREEADHGRPQARPQPEGTAGRQGDGRDDPGADAEGGREGREGHAGRGAGRRRHRQAQRARHHQEDRRATRTSCCARRS